MKCQETSTIVTGRWSEQRPCRYDAKHEIVAYVSSRGIRKGDTIHVCTTHRKVHERAEQKDREFDRRYAESNSAHDAARARARKLGAGSPHHQDYQNATKPGGYTGGLVLTADEVDRLLERLGL